MTLADVLQSLRVPRGGLLYAQSSVDWLHRAGIPSTTIIPSLRQWIGSDATLAMPSYPMRVPHAEYLATNPEYDVRRTPVAIGLVAELFRRTPGVIRSLEPDYTVAVQGPLAERIAGQPPAEDPFGPASPYRRMLQAGGTLVGLGVSLNTNSFIHAFDEALESGYGRPVYYPDRVSVPVTNHAGERQLVPRRVIRPEFQRLTQPSAVARAVGPGAAFDELVIDSVQFFRWDLDALQAWCLEHGRTRAAAGRLPCWLHRLEGEG